MNNLIEISKESNSNYLGKIIKIEHIEKHPNADRLQVTSVDFQEVITGSDAQVGDYYVYFPVECKINEYFLKETNSFREKTLNDDITQCGFFEENCRVRAMKLRGERSCGYIVPTNVIEEFCKCEGLSRYAGEYFDTINGIKMLEKYVVKEKSPNNTSVKVSKESLIVDNQFHYHIDTENLRRNAFKISPHDDISVTYKVHGTSFIASKVLIKSELSIVEKAIKAIKRYAPKISSYFPKIVETEYGYVVSSRRVIKSVEGKTFEGSNHFYDEDIWSTVGHEIKDNIPDGYTVYAEIVEYTSSNSSIQGDYDYGCKEKEHKLYVYRVTFTNPQGIVHNLNTNDTAKFCSLNGFNFVPLFFVGKAKEVFPELDLENHWTENFVQELEKKYNDKNCFICKNKVPEEGIVVRVEKSYSEFEAYKLKSFKFLEKETKDLDKGTENIEDSN